MAGPTGPASSRRCSRCDARHQRRRNPTRANVGLGGSVGQHRMTRRAMLLAAGLGTRRPLTDRMPKPLLPLGGKALIDHALDRLEEAGVETVVVNAHWQADQLAAYLARR